MNRLGTETNSKKKWALPAPKDSLQPGSVIMAEPGSFDHYFLESLVLIIEHDAATGTRGVLLNHETPWEIDEMVPGSNVGPFSANPLFLGGDAGKDTMLMIHGEGELPGAKHVGKGVYLGGVTNAIRAVEEGALPADRFKFFFKTVEWLPNQLQSAVDGGLFQPIELSPGWLFGQSGQRSMWGEVRDTLPFDASAGEDDQVTGAMADQPGDAASGGLPYERKEALKSSDAPRDLAAEALNGASKMSQALDEHREARAAHDVKLKAYVAQLVAEKEAKKKAETAAREKAAAAAAAQSTPAPEVVVPPEVTRAADKMQARSPDDGGSDNAGMSSMPPMSEEQDAKAAAKAWLAERGIVAPQAESMVADGSRKVGAAEGPQVQDQEEPPRGAAAAESSAAGIEALLDFRTFLGNEQWLVRWSGYEGGETWETWQVLDTEELRARAEALRREKRA